MDNENNGEKDSLLGIVGKVLITFGALSLVTYLAVRWLVIANGGGRDIYGVWLFHPDRILEIIALSSLMIFFGLVLYFINKQLMKLKEMTEELEYYKPIP
ncbi:MAG: hypothetical protein U9O96_02415 [Candidatus Thermoplasmatota archaeon]|nr:hypothetical protein [Candidatus Thermoplasmatota archaeon]